ncbi:MAG: M28 family peptidase [Bacteroidota bacterium]
MQGRYPGTPGIERAARYIEQSFREAGVTNVRREEFEISQRGPGEVYLRSGNKKFLNPNDIIIFGSAHINNDVEKQLVFGGRGTADELSSIDVEGRVVLVFVSNLRSTYEVAHALHNRKAFALIAANPDNPAQFQSMNRTFKDHITAKRLFLDSDTIRRVPFLDTMRSACTFVIKNELIPVLMNTSSKNLSRSIDSKTVKDIPVASIGLKSEFVTNTIRSANIIAHLPGSTDTTIIISAHYDHMGQSGNDIFRGADDNASGTASIIALAKRYSAMKLLKYSMTFIALTGEEVGLLGSRYHTTKKDFDPSKVIFNLNIDMVGSIDSKHRSGQPYIYVVQHTDSLAMSDLLEQAAKANDIILDHSENGTIGMFQRSDQYSFHRRGIPAVHFFSGLHDRYHKPTDTYDSLNYPLLVRRAELANSFLLLMQQ